MTPSQTSKIHVTWPAGCYGSYIMQSIYVYSNLDPTSTSEIIIDPTGSSHTFRDSKEKRKHFTFSHNMTDTSDISIGPNNEHALDYFVNQFVKAHSDIIKYLGIVFENSQLQTDKNWKNKDVWEIREWISFCLLEILNASYNWSITTDFTTDQLFSEDEDCFPKLINRLNKKLGLITVANVDTIKDNHKIWTNSQVYHNLQKRCDKWVSEIITTQENTASPCITIIDEAYVQSRLRSYGYEIRCFELNVFPKTSNELRSLLYKETQDDTAAKTEDC